MVSVTSQESHLGTNEGGVGSYHLTNVAKCFALLITHVLKAIEAGMGTVYTEPTLASATPTKGEKMEFKIACSEYSDNVRTYNNNKSKVA